MVRQQECRRGRRLYRCGQWQEIMQSSMQDCTTNKPSSTSTTSWDNEESSPDRSARRISMRRWQCCLHWTGLPTTGLIDVNSLWIKVQSDFQFSSNFRGSSGIARLHSEWSVCSPQQTHFAVYQQTSLSALVGTVPSWWPCLFPRNFFLLVTLYEILVLVVKYICNCSELQYWPLK